MGSVKKYNLIVFDTFNEAKAARKRIEVLCAESEQVNVVIREEGNMEDGVLLGIDPKVKVFAGKAWTTIHERRAQEGWYDGNEPPTT